MQSGARGRRFQFADQLHIQPLPFDLTGCQSLLCWDPRSDADGGIRWLKQQIVAIAAEAG